MDVGIMRKEWKEYFMGLLGGGVENRIVRGDERSMEEDGEEDISRRKIKGTIKRLKDGKAAGIDGIPSGACGWGDAPPTLDGASPLQVRIWQTRGTRAGERKTLKNRDGDGPFKPSAWRLTKEEGKPLV